MNIRKYRDHDYEALIALWKHVFPDDPPHNAPEAVIPQKLAVDDLIFIIDTGDTIAGACMAGYDGHRGWLYAVALHTQYRGQGWGAELVNFVLSELKNQGCQKINLQIRADNHEVEQFYQTLGFETEPRISMGKFI